MWKRFTVHVYLICLFPLSFVCFSVAMGLRHWSLPMVVCFSLTLPTSHSAGWLPRPRLAGLHRVPHHVWRHGAIAAFAARPLVSAHVRLHLARRDTCVCEYHVCKHTTIYRCLMCHAGSRPSLICCFLWCFWFSFDEEFNIFSSLQLKIKLINWIINQLATMLITSWTFK